MGEYLDLTWIKDYKTFKNFDITYRTIIPMSEDLPLIKISQELNDDVLNLDKYPSELLTSEKKIKCLLGWKIYVEEDINVKNILKEYGFTSVELGDNWWKYGSVYISEKVLSDLLDINNKKIKQKILEDVDRWFNVYENIDIQKENIEEILDKRFGF